MSYDMAFIIGLTLLFLFLAILIARLETKEKLKMKTKEDNNFKNGQNITVEIGGKNVCEGVIPHKFVIFRLIEIGGEKFGIVKSKDLIDMEMMQDHGGLRRDITFTDQSIGILYYSTGDVNLMRYALKEFRFNKLEKSLLYSGVINILYGERDQLNSQQELYKFGLEYKKVLPKLINIQEYNVIPELPKLIKAFTEMGYYDDAISLCDIAMQLNIIDKTKDGYKGRKQKVEKEKIKRIKKGETDR